MKVETFCYLIPIFNFKIVPSGATLQHSGVLDGDKYDLTLKHYEEGSEELLKLLKRTDFSFNSLAGSPLYFHVVPEHFLTIEANQRWSRAPEGAANSPNADRIRKAILDALRLHASRGILYYQTYVSRYPSKGFFLTMAPSSSQDISSQGLLEPSVLTSSLFVDCIQSFETLLNKRWDDSITVDRILKLALAYHETTFHLLEVEHSFLLLMVIFDALFKRPKESTAGKASSRISELLSSKKSDRKAILKQFFGEDTHTFYKLRNQIVHGDPNLDIDVIKSKYPLLYQYITGAIVRVLEISRNEIDPTADYYDEISGYIDRYFTRLPHL